MSNIEQVLYNENLIEDIRYIILSIAFIFAFGVVNLFSKRMEKGFLNSIEFVNGKLKVSRRLKIMEQIEKATRMGALEEFPKITIPLWFVLYHIIVGGIFGLIVAFIIWFFLTPRIDYTILGGFVGFILGYKVFDVYLKSKNDKANEQITKDVLVISNILIGQISGGQYTGTALGECADVVRNKRFKKAIEEFSREMETNEKTIVEATKSLEYKFNNIDIDNLCMVIVQNEESGRSKSILEDLSKQILVSEKSVHDRQKEKLNRMMTYAVMILFGDLVGYVVWLFATTITSNMNIF